MYLDMSIGYQKRCKFMLRFDITLFQINNEMTECGPLEDGIQGKTRVRSTNLAVCHLQFEDEMNSNPEFIHISLKVLR